MIKLLTLDPEQKKELESDLAPELFVKEHEKNLVFKQALELIIGCLNL